MLICEASDQSLIRTSFRFTTNLENSLMCQAVKKHRISSKLQELDDIIKTSSIHWVNWRSILWICVLWSAGRKILKIPKSDQWISIYSKNLIVFHFHLRHTSMTWNAQNCKKIRYTQYQLSYSLKGSKLKEQWTEITGIGAMMHLWWNKS